MVTEIARTANTKFLELAPNWPLFTIPLLICLAIAYIFRRKLMDSPFLALAVLFSLLLLVSYVMKIGFT